LATGDSAEGERDRNSSRQTDHDKPGGLTKHRADRQLATASCHSSTKWIKDL
jgi:hypothetical protein